MFALRWKKWVKSYVNDHKLCPFAKKSDYQITIWPEKIVNRSADDVGIQDFMRNEMDKLVEIKSTAQNKGKLPIYWLYSPL